MNVENKKVTVLGAARSGFAAADLLSSHGANVFLSDFGTPYDIEEKLEVLKGIKTEYEFGGHSDRVFEADFVVLSPGIPKNAEVVRGFYKKKIPVFSEIEVASWFNKSQLIAVTGSNGKTTTVSLIGEMLRQKYPDAIVAGNIGQAFSGFVFDSKKDSWAVVELSSFQLETIDTFRPQITVILNFAPNHLDRYDSYDDYLKAKWRITKNLSGNDLLIYNADDEKLKSWVKKLSIQAFGFSTKSINKTGAGLHNYALYMFGRKLVSTGSIALKGIHNYMNAMAASLSASKAGVDNDQITEVLQNFHGVEHRMEEVGVINGVTFVNDSKATTVESLMMALQSYSNPVVLIAGGKDKGSDFSRLNDLVRAHVKALVLIGTAANAMKNTWENIKPVYIEETMKSAIKKAFSLSVKNDVVLLSPACASFDMFSSYEERGVTFKKEVMAIRNKEKNV